MQFAPEVAEAFKTWVGIRSWASGHPLDRQRFHEFVHAYSRAHGTRIDESGLRDAILSTATTPANEHHRDAAREHARTMVKILDFERTLKR